MSAREDENEVPVSQLEDQVGRVLAAIRANPAKKRRILAVYIANFLGAVKETIRTQGRIMPFYMVMADSVDFGVPPITEEVTTQARHRKAEALVWVEGFQSANDISDVIYHVAMSAPCLGVVGWLLKVKLGDGKVEFTREVPYHFDTPEKTKTLGEMIEELKG